MPVNTLMSFFCFFSVGCPHGVAFPHTLWVLPLAVLLALGSVVGWLFWHRHPATESSVFEITQFVHDCAGIYLKSQYKLVAKVMVAFAAFIFLGSFWGHFNHFFGIAIFFGGIWSALIGYLALKFGLSIAAKSTEKIKQHGPAGAQFLCISGGMLVMLCAGVVLADMALWFWVLNWIFDHNVLNLSTPIIQKLGFTHTWTPDMAADPAFIRFKFDEIALILLSYAIGASVYALMSRISGGILRQSTHAAIDNAFATSGFTLPEDDIRHPGIMAEWIGRHAGGVTGALAGLYQLIAICLAIAVYLGAFLLETMAIGEGIHAIIFPFVVVGIGLLASLFGFCILFFVRTKSPEQRSRNITYGQIGVACVGLLAGLGMWATQAFFSGFVFAAMIGILASTCLGLGVRTFTHRKGRQIAALLATSPSGFGALLLRGIELGFLCAFIPVMTLVMAFGAAYVVGGGLVELAAGMYAVIVCAVAAISTGLYLHGIALSAPLAATGLGLSRMMQHEEIAADLQTIEADTNSAGVAAALGDALVLALMVVTTITALLVSIKHWIHKLAGTDGISIGQTYFVNHPLPQHPQAVVVSEIHVLELSERLGVSMLNPQFTMGALIGLMTVIGLAGWCIRKSNTCAEHLAAMNRREFTENPDIATGAILPRYGDSISFSTLFSQKSILSPLLLACLSTVGVSFLWGIAGSIGHLLGTLISLLIITLTGGSLATLWNNAWVTASPLTPLSDRTLLGNNATESTLATLKTLGKAGGIVPYCVGPILNTVMILMVSLSMLLGLISLKFGHILVH